MRSSIFTTILYKARIYGAHSDYDEGFGDSSTKSFLDQLYIRIENSTASQNDEVRSRHTTATAPRPGSIHSCDMPYVNHATKSPSGAANTNAVIMTTSLMQSLIKSVMRLWPPYVTVEGVRDPDALKQSLSAAQYRYDYEGSIPFLSKYFPTLDTNDLRGKHVLDLGCFTGGRLVRWIEDYGLIGYGLDISADLIEPAKVFAQQHRVTADFRVAFGEAMPYPDATFDYIASYDVFEHVRSVEETLRECHRVLKPGGMLLCVFPPFYQPLEAHLGIVTGWPALHWIFPHKALGQAYRDLMLERGEIVSVHPWEKLPTLNGVTVRQFRKLIRGWNLRYWGTAPILSDGRRAQKPLFRALRSLFVIPARLPVLEELFLGRVCCVLEKGEPSRDATR